MRQRSNIYLGVINILVWPKYGITHHKMYYFHRIKFCFCRQGGGVAEVSLTVGGSYCTW